VSGVQALLARAGEACTPALLRLADMPKPSSGIAQ